MSCLYHSFSVHAHTNTYLRTTIRGRTQQTHLLCFILHSTRRCFTSIALRCNDIAGVSLAKSFWLSQISLVWLVLVIMYVDSPKHIPLMHSELWTTALAECRQLFDYGTKVFSGKGKMWYSTWSPLLPVIQVLLSEHFPLSLLMRLQPVHLWPLCWSKWCMCSTRSTIKVRTGLVWMASNLQTSDTEAKRGKFACRQRLSSKSVETWTLS